MAPVTSLHLFQASRTLFLQSVVDPLSASNIDPRYLKVVTFPEAGRENGLIINFI